MSCSTSSRPTYRDGFWTDQADLDEGIKALLLFRGEGDVNRQGAGFDRTRAFRAGVIDGAQGCLSFTA